MRSRYYLKVSHIVHGRYRYYEQPKFFLWHRRRRVVCSACYEEERDDNRIFACDYCQVGVHFCCSTGFFKLYLCPDCVEED